MLSAIWQQIRDFFFYMAFITWVNTKSEDSLAYTLVWRNATSIVIYKLRSGVSESSDERDGNHFRDLLQALKKIIEILKYL